MHLRQLLLLFEIAGIWKQLQCSSTDDGLKKICVHTTEYLLLSCKSRESAGIFINKNGPNGCLDSLIEISQRRTNVLFYLEGKQTNVQIQQKQNNKKPRC